MDRSKRYCHVSLQNKGHGGALEYHMEETEKACSSVNPQDLADYYSTVMQDNVEEAQSGPECTQKLETDNIRLSPC